MVHVPLMFLSEWREFPSAPYLAGTKKLMTARVSMLLKSRASPDMLPFSLCNKNQHFLKLTPLLSLSLPYMLFLNPEHSFYTNQLLLFSDYAVVFVFITHTYTAFSMSNTRNVSNFLQLSGCNNINQFYGRGIQRNKMFGHLKFSATSFQ